MKQWLRDGGQDSLFAIRLLRRSPVFAATAVITIALGVGASTAIFSVTNAVLLRPLPYRNPDRLVLATVDLRKSNTLDLPVNNADFFDLRNGTKDVFDAVGTVMTFRVIVPREDGRPERIYKAQVTSNFFRMMGARIAFGRDFAEADGLPQPSEPQTGLPVGSVAILSYEYFLRRYGANPAAIGRELRSTNQRGPRIIGVLAPGFQLLLPPSLHTEVRPDVWIANNLGYDRGPAGQRVIARLRGGVSLRRAQEQVELLAAQMRRNSAERADAGMYIRLEPMLRYLVAEIRPALVALIGAVIFLLLIACANVGNLLLARISMRERELAMRAALGARHGRLVRQMLAEAFVLSACGTLAGLGLAWLGMHRLLHLAPATLPRLETAGIDLRVFAFAAAAGLAAAGIFGLLPSWRAARPHVMPLLRGSGRSAALGTGRILRHVVVVAEVALAFVLLTGSGLILRSFVALQRIDPGYDPHGLLTFLLVRDSQWAQKEQGAALLRQIQARLRALPGVENAAACAPLPLTGGLGPEMEWSTAQTLATGTKPGAADVQAVLPGYFETVRAPLVAGRTFNSGDNGRNVVIIDQSLAAKAFPHESAIGKRIRIDHPEPAWLEVIGVVKHQRLVSLAEPGREQMYFTDAFFLVGVSRHWAVRTAGDPAKMAPLVGGVLASLDPQLLMLEVQSMDKVVSRAQASTRFSLLLVGVFAVAAALLAGVGLYGVLSNVVAQRTAEIGVRMALGASPAGIFQLMVGHGLRLSAAGISIGLVLTLAFTRAMAGMLVGVAPYDPSTYVAIAVIFCLIAAMASWLPARRAARLDPVVALREQ